MKKFKIKVVFTSSPEIQLKSFKDATSAMEWCRRNHEQIMEINGCVTNGKLVNHYQLNDIFNNLCGLQLNLGL